jgi:hypothetical protein
MNILDMSITWNGLNKIIPGTQKVMAKTISQKMLALMDLLS